MSRNPNHLRFVELEQSERKAAANTADPAARDAHEALAERYADRAWSIDEGYDPGD